MPRIRTLKPEFWSDEKLAPLPPITRLVFLGLISLADDKGRLIDNEKSLDGSIFAETSDSCRESLEVLTRLSRISRYVAGSGQKVIQINNWDRHQKIAHPSPHNLPDPSTSTHSDDSGSGNVASFSCDSHEELMPLPTTNDQRSGPTTKDRKSAAASPRFAPPTVDQVATFARESGLTMDPQRFVDHFTSNGWKVSGKTKMVDWQAAVRNWAGNEFPKSGVSRRGAIASGPGQRLHVAGKAVADDAF